MKPSLYLAILCALFCLAGSGESQDQDRLLTDREVKNYWLNESLDAIKNADSSAARIALSQEHAALQAAINSGACDVEAWRAAWDWNIGVYEDRGDLVNAARARDEFLKYHAAFMEQVAQEEAQARAHAEAEALRVAQWRRDQEARALQAEAKRQEDEIRNAAVIRKIQMEEAIRLEIERQMRSRDFFGR